MDVFGAGDHGIAVRVSENSGSHSETILSRCAGPAADSCAATSHFSCSSPVLVVRVPFGSVPVFHNCTCNHELIV